MTEQLQEDDNWAAHDDLNERWAEAGGFSNPKFVMPFRRNADIGLYLFS